MWDRYLYKSQGVRTFFTGLHLHILRDALGTALYFGSYEAFHLALSPTGKRDGAGPLIHFLSGGLAGMSSWLLIFPIDLVKSRIQKTVSFNEDRSKLPKIVPVIQEVIRHGGLRALYSGIMPTLVRAFPAHSINFLIYEAALEKSREFFAPRKA